MYIFLFPVNASFASFFPSSFRGRYFLVEITFDMLMEEMKCQGHHKIDILEKVDGSKSMPEKKVKKKHNGIIQKFAETTDSTTTLKPSQPVEARQKRKLNRAHVPIK